jgi:phosphoribosylformylglycinamidine cyclo-ligase
VFFGFRSRKSHSRNTKDANGITYAAAGVDLEASERAISIIREKVKRTFRPEVVGDIGGFAGLFRPDFSGYKDPVLVASTDGVGTKLVVAQMMGRHDTVGRDLVAMCVDDIVCLGAEPLFFLDYIACGSLDEKLVAQIVEGIAQACREARCALIGGEIAEHPHRASLSKAPDYDLAGFVVGVVEADRMITGSAVAPGDSIVGIESGGLMSNGYSLARKALFEVAGYSLDERLPGIPHRLGDELLKPTPIYAPAILHLLRSEIPVHGIAHITGGGIPGNMVRILPRNTKARIFLDRWETDPIFRAIQDAGRVSSQEMYRVFNMGLGMLLVVPSEVSHKVVDEIRSQGHHAHIVGQIEQGKGDPEVILDGLPG